MTFRAVTFAVALAAPLLAVPARAFACGASGPDGVSACSLDEHALDGSRWVTGVSGVYTWTALRFSGGRRADEERGAAVASLGYRVSTRVTLQGAAGASLGGRLSLAGVSSDFDPGLAAALGASWRVVDAEGARPFVILTAQLAATITTTSAGAGAAHLGYEAFDLRAGALVGTTFFSALSPYLAARVFGGPAYWRDPSTGTAITGTDVSHYQLGAGASLLLARHVNVFAEGIPLGERAVSAGISAIF